MSAESEAIAVEVQAERDRQDQKWGEQNHPDGTGPSRMILGDLKYTKAFDGHRGISLATASADVLAGCAKQVTDSAAKQGNVFWQDILLEEVFEAFAESDTSKLRTELIQVAAVAQQWVEAIDRR
ncbi:hypothetical protein, partial [Subtercola vilae]